MLCSAPAQKSGLNWLDRLRSNKGIPTGDDLDLDSFLSNPKSSDSISQPTHLSKIPTLASAHVPPPLGSVLADLFNIGGRLSYGKKCPRKQTNPKFFLASSSSLGNNTGIIKDDNVPAAADSFGDDAGRLRGGGLDCCDVEEEKENDLRGFSKSEVTVIDTSCPGWKADKFVFRKNNVWKVRERKGKSKSFPKKKNKGTLGFVYHNSSGAKKAAKAMEFQFGSIEEGGQFIINPST